MFSNVLELLSFSVISENKLAAAGTTAIVLGMILIASGAGVKVDEETKEGASKKKTLMSLGGSVVAVGVLHIVADQYLRRTSSAEPLASAEMSSTDLLDFQARVAAAAENLRSGMEEVAVEATEEVAESSSELAARASAQISSFIQNYA